MMLISYNKTHKLKLDIIQIKFQILKNKMKTLQKMSNKIIQMMIYLAKKHRRRFKYLQLFIWICLNFFLQNLLFVKLSMLVMNLPDLEDCLNF
jgi:hypothetical protein